MASWSSIRHTSHIQDGQSVVFHQPSTDAEKEDAIKAMISCPTGSIRTETPELKVKQVMDSFPLNIDSEEIPEVYHLGFHSKFTYGAASYLIVRNGGQDNVMIDTPKFSEALAKKIEALGAAPTKMIITHRDHVGEQAKWKVREKRKDLPIAHHQL